MRIFELAATYGFGIAEKHVCIDGNKRIALLSIRPFLIVNGYQYCPEDFEMIGEIAIYHKAVRLLFATRIQ